MDRNERRKTRQEEEEGEVKKCGIDIGGIGRG